MLYDPELRANGGSVIAYEPCPSAAAERALLGCVMSLYKAGSLPGALQDIYAQQVRQQLQSHLLSVGCSVVVLYAVANNLSAGLLLPCRAVACCLSTWTLRWQPCGSTSGAASAGPQQQASSGSWRQCTPQPRCCGVLRSAAWAWAGGLAPQATCWLSCCCLQDTAGLSSCAPPRLWAWPLSAWRRAGCRRRQSWRGRHCRCEHRQGKAGQGPKPHMGW
jgi:hypothetical protein